MQTHKRNTHQSGSLHWSLYQLEILQALNLLQHYLNQNLLMLIITLPISLCPMTVAYTAKVKKRTTKFSKLRWFKKLHFKAFYMFHLDKNSYLLSCTCSLHCRCDDLLLLTFKGKCVYTLCFLYQTQTHRGVTLNHFEVYHTISIIVSRKMMYCENK